LAEHGISYEMIPGVTSSIAAAAYAGIPVTHREYSNTFTIATGHSKGELELDFTALAKSKTCAFYMGIQNLPFICEQLIANGRGESTPVAVIEWGTTGRQKTATGTLRTIVQAVQESEIANPAMTVVGEAVQLRGQLAWFERKPYYGKRVLIAKSSAQQSGIAGYLAESGAEVWEIPHFKKETLSFSKEELAAAFQAERLVFTANESAALFMEAIVQAGYDVRDLPRQIQGVSEKSRAELNQFGVQAQEAILSSCRTIYIGHVLSDTGREALFAAYGCGKMLYTHEIKQDVRFHEVTERLWTEFSWDTVLFPNQAAIEAFMGEMGRLGVSEDILALRYAYLGERTGKAARTYGFMNLDEQLQEMLSSREWKNKTIS
jgi:uroporphyrinogen III methyltransferase/synthase